MKKQEPATFLEKQSLEIKKEKGVFEGLLLSEYGNQDEDDGYDANY